MTVPSVREPEETGFESVVDWQVRPETAGSWKSTRTTSDWHFRFAQPDLLDIEIRKKLTFVGAFSFSREEWGSNPNDWNILDVTLMNAII